MKNNDYRLNNMKEDSIFTKGFLFLFLINYCFFTIYSCFQILPVYLRELGASNLYIGIFMNLNALELILFVFFFRKIFRNKARKTLLLIGFACSSIALVIMFLFNNNLVLLIILNFFSGLAFAFGFTLLFSMLYDIVPINKRIGGAAVFGISGIISNPTGAMLGEMVYRNGKPGFIFLISLSFSLTAFLLTIFLKEKKYEYSGNNLNIMQMIFNNGLLSLVFFSIILGGAYGVFCSFIPTYTKNKIGVTNITYFFTSFAIIATCVRLFLFRILDRVSSKFLIIISLSLMLVSMSSLLILKHLWQLFFIGFVYGISHSILFPVLSTLFVNKAEFEFNKINYNNIFLLFYNLGLIFFSSVLGLVGDLFSLFTTFLSMNLIVFMGFVSSFFLKKVNAE